MKDEAVSMTHTLAAADVEIAFARGAAYGLIGRSFHDPDGPLLSSLGDAPCWATWPAVLERMDPEFGPLLASTRAAVERCLKFLAAGGPAALQEHYDGLFGHAVRGRCPAYEMEYGRSEIIHQASQLADLAGFYHAFGVDVVDGLSGRPDHVSVECEFMSVLCAKEAHAIMLPDNDKAEVCVDAERAFLKEHLARWLPAFAHRVKRADGTGLYGTMARFATAFIAKECDRLDVQAGPETLELRPADPILDRTISCGPADCPADATSLPMSAHTQAGCTQAGEPFVRLEVNNA